MTWEARATYSPYVLDGGEPIPTPALNPGVMRLLIPRTPHTPVHPIPPDDSGTWELVGSSLAIDADGRAGVAWYWKRWVERAQLDSVAAEHVVPAGPTSGSSGPEGL